jgi:TatD DNase family protein
MQLIDSHCHLNRLKLGDETMASALASAKEAGVVRLMSIMCDFDEYDELQRIRTDHADCGIEIGLSVGVHPCEDAKVLNAATTEKLTMLADRPEVWAIGETGLDFFHSTDFKAEQEASLIRHIEVSNALKKPLVIHARDAKEDTLRVLRDNPLDAGILHCFTEDWDMAEQLLEMGLFISFSGIVSFKNAKQIHEVATKIPLDRMLIETDAPYLAPTPHRGKPNQPKWVGEVARAIGDLRGVSPELIASKSTQNFNQLMRFG